MKKLSSTYRNIRNLSVLFWNGRVVSLAVAFLCLIFEVNAAQQLPGAKPVSGPSTNKVVPRPLKSLQINPTAVAGGATPRPQGTVELVQAPGPGGVTVKLESSNPELVNVPQSVTITHGAMSSETGAVSKATFYITSQPVNENTFVTIKARVGAQSLEARIQIVPPRLKTANLGHPRTCDGGKATLHYTLTGPAPSGATVRVTNIRVRSPTGNATGPDESESVPTGNPVGSLRVTLPQCRSTTAQWCTIDGKVWTGGSIYGSSVSFGGSCPPPN